MKRFKIMLLAGMIGLIMLGGSVFAVNDEVLKESEAVYTQAKELENGAEAPSVTLVKVIMDADRNLLSDWIVFKPEYEERVFEEANLVIRENQLISATIFNQTFSGDWFKWTRYYFRKNGSVACIFCDFATFYGEVRVETELYFDPSGTQVKEKRSFFDLEGEAVAEPSPDAFFDNPPEVFLTAEAILRALNYAIR